MKCIQCGAEIKDDAKFCKVCGAKQDIQEEPKRLCRACGAPLKPGAAFCTACGARADGEPQQKPTGAADRAQAGFAHTAATGKNNAAPQQAAPQEPAGKKKKYLPIIIAVAALLCVGVSAAVILKFTVFATPVDQTAAEGDTPKAQAEQQTEEVEEVTPGQIDSSDADLIADGEISLQGAVKISTDNRLFLDWGEPKSILMKEEDGEYVRLNDVSSAYLQNEGVDGSLWDELPLDQEVLVTGELELDGSRLILEARRMTNPDGTAIVAQAEQAASEEILPQSDTRLLTQQDVAGLSLREINYAKNEIYARHGRKFSSKELQDYFNAQSWYHGTVDAANFKESSLSDIEKKNAEFLAEVEFSIAPNGYQLDQ